LVLILLAPALAITVAPSANASPEQDPVGQALAAYEAQTESALKTNDLEAVLSAPAATDRLAMTAGALANSDTTDIAASFAQAGLDIVSAAVDVTDADVESPSSVTATVTTTVTVRDRATQEISDASWSDTHVLALAGAGDGTRVVSDRIEDDRATADTTPADGTVSAATPAALLATAASSRKEPNVDTIKFITYALKWTQGSAMNSAYPSYSNNCANFASQVLDNAGWSYAQGNSLQVSDTSVWTPNLRGVAGASRTWSAARYLYTFAKNSGAYTTLSDKYKATPGDLLFVDWDPNGKADGTIDHVMVVTGSAGTNMPRISQKSPNRHNIPLSTSITLAKQQGKTKITWHALKHH